MSSRQIATNILGRLLVGGAILWIVIGNFRTMGDAVGFAASKGLMWANILTPFAQILLGVSGVMILVGLRPMIASLLLVAFLIPVTLIMHNYWVGSGIAALLDLKSFQGNMMMMGLALIIAALSERPWPWSVDMWLATGQINKTAEGLTQRQA